MTVPQPLTKEPPWLTAMADQRLAQFNAAVPKLVVGDLAGAEVVMFTLTDPSADTERAVDRWNNSCDNCGEHCPDTLLTGHVGRAYQGKDVVITFGACPDCAGVA